MEAVHFTPFMQFPLSLPIVCSNQKSDLLFWACFWSIMGTVLFLVHSRVIQYFYSFQNDHHYNSSYHLPPYKDTVTVDYVLHTLIFIPHLRCNSKLVPLNLPHICVTLFLACSLCLGLFLSYDIGSFVFYIPHKI